MALAKGVYKIKNVSSGKVLDVKGDSDKSKANVFQYKDDSSDGQRWTLSNTKSGIQLICTLSGKSLDIQGKKAAKDKNVYQYSDKNTKTQRWNIVAYKNKKHDGRQIYFIKPKANSKLAIGVSDNSNSSNVKVRTYNKSDTKQQWVFIPIERFKAEDEYRIIIGGIKKLPHNCIGVKGNGVKNGTLLSAEPINNDNNFQVWKSDYDPQTGLIRFTNAATGLYLGVKGAAKNNGDVALNNQKSAATNWLVYNGGKNKDVNKNKLQTYKFRTELGSSELFLDLDKSYIKIGSSEGKDWSQHFAFLPAEIYGGKITQPGGITASQPLITNGIGFVPIPELSFASSYKMFQARCKIRTYKDGNCSTYEETGFMNIRDRSTSNNAWGEPRTVAINNSKSTDNIHNIPQAFFTKGSKSNLYLLEPKNYARSHTSDLNKGIYSGVGIDLIIEVRAYVTNYKIYGQSGWNAHGNVRQSTIKIRQKPVVSLSRMEFVIANNSIGIKTTISNNLNILPIQFRGRLIGGDGMAISGWASSSGSNTITHMFGSTLTRMPDNNETITLDLVAMFKDDVLVQKRVSYSNFSKSSLSNTIVPTVTNSTDYSGVVTVSAPARKSICLLMDIEDVDGVHSVLYKPRVENNVATWRIVPPFNKDVKIEIYGKNDISNGEYGSSTVRMDSHFSVWAWTDEGIPFSKFAILLANNDAPPDQTRTFSSSLSVHSPAGRKWPVAFAGLTLTGDVSVKGIALDGSGGVGYVASGPIPEYASMKHLSALARLSGLGIHPIYRTPYGDWYQVAISSINLSKSDLGYSEVSVSQQIVED